MVEKEDSKIVVKLVNILHLSEEWQMKIRDIRNEDNVRRWMYSDHLVSLEEHRRWLERLAPDVSQIVFAVTPVGGEPLGVVSINSLDRAQKRSEWAFYLTQDARGGLGSALEFAFINFLFDTVGIEKLNCEVIEGNAAVVRLHKKFLFKEEGFRRSDIIKNGERVGVHLLGLTRKDWDEGRSELIGRYADYFDKFDISIDY